MDENEFCNMDQKNTCIVCLRFFNEASPMCEIPTDYAKQIYRCCDKYKYLSTISDCSDEFDNSFQWKFCEQDDYTLCTQCFTSVENLFKLDEQLTEIQLDIQNCIHLFTTQVLEHRFQVKSWQHDQTQREQNPIIDHDLDDLNDIKSSPSARDCDPVDTIFSPSTSLEDTDDEFSREPTQFVNENETDESSNDVNPKTHLLRKLVVVLPALQMDTMGEVVQPTNTNVPRSRNGRFTSKRKAAVAAEKKFKKISRFEIQGNDPLRGKAEIIDDDDLYKTDGSSDSEMEKHTRKHKAKPQTPKKRVYRVAKRFPCTKCKMAFNFSKELDFHSLKKRHKNEKKFKCNKLNCMRSFYRKLDLKYHKRYHTNRIRVHKCSYCLQIFKKLDFLKKHNCSRTKQRLHCDKCGSTFTRKLLFNTHLCTAKSFDCDVCTAKFSWKILLNQHKDKHNEVTYKCVKCFKRFSKKSTLNRHSRLRCTPSHTFTCRNCKKTFITYKYRKIHNCKRIPQVLIKANFVCVICQSTFALTKEMDNHCKVSGHLNERKFRCMSCSKCFYRSRDLHWHRKVHTSNRSREKAEIKTYCCEVCQKECKGKGALFSHVRFCYKNIIKSSENDDATADSHSIEKLRNTCDEHGWSFTLITDYQQKTAKAHDVTTTSDIKEVVCCDVCGKKFNKTSLLKRHVQIHLKTNAYKCDSCDMAYNTARKLRHHVIKEHTTTTPFECTECEAKFKARYDFNRHVKRHELNKEKKFICDGCGKRFSDMTFLRRHMALHTDVRFSCSQCDKRFVRKSYLTHHVKVVHTKELTYKCDKCEKCFLHKSHLKTHLSKHNEVKCYECKFCQKKFKNFNTLRAHENVHTGVTFDCEICSRAFYNKSSLHIHYKVHGEKLHQCETCGKSFKRKDGLISHMRSHTGDIPHTCELCGKKFRTVGPYNTHRRWHEIQKVS